MQNWVNFCDIKKRIKNESLAVVISARFFLKDDAIKKLKGKKLMLVPPELDCPRELSVKESKQKGKNDLELSFNEKADESLIFEGKSLLMNKEDFCEVFGDLASKESELVGKLVKDQQLGSVGHVKDVSGTNSQRHLVVDHEGDEILIPYVDGIVVSVQEDEITTKLPAGILEINGE